MHHSPADFKVWRWSFKASLFKEASYFVKVADLINSYEEKETLLRYSTLVCMSDSTFYFIKAKKEGWQINHKCALYV